jgi:hypothetical protein
MTEIYDPADPAVVYLRPGTSERPIELMKTLEKGGMLIDGKYCIAMYTSGVQGPSGSDVNSVFDTIIASASDENTPITVGGPKTTFRAPYALDLGVAGHPGYIRISLTTAPTGAAFIVDVTMNGASMFSTPVQIDPGEKTSVTSLTPAVLAITDVPDDAEFLVYVTQIGSTLSGTGLKVAVTGTRVA